MTHRSPQLIIHFALTSYLVRNGREQVPIGHVSFMSYDTIYDVCLPSKRWTLGRQVHLELTHDLNPTLCITYRTCSTPKMYEYDTKCLYWINLIHNLQQISILCFIKTKLDPQLQMGTRGAILQPIARQYMYNVKCSTHHVMMTTCYSLYSLHSHARHNTSTRFEIMNTMSARCQLWMQVSYGSFHKYTSHKEIWLWIVFISFMATRKVYVNNITAWL